MITSGEITIRLHVVPLAEGGFVATSPDVPGLVAEGRTIGEAAEIARDLTRRIVESYLDHGDPIPATLQPLAGGVAVDLLVPVPIR